MTSFANVADFDKTNTGYTNRYLEKRNDLRTPVLQKSFQMISQPVQPTGDYVYSVTKDLEKTPVSRIFFSQKNLDYLQDMMRKIIFKESGHTIGRQSDEELLIIMRSYYFSDAKNLPYDIHRQVAELNRLTLKYAVYEEVLPKVKGYASFLNENFRTNVVMPRERTVTMKGARINRGFADLI
jgi:hypothetical protein